MSDLYAWEVLESILRTLRVPKAPLVAQQVYEGLSERGWRLVREDDEGAS